MISKILKVFVLSGVLGIHTGCLQLSNDSGGVSNNISSSSQDSSQSKRVAGTLSLLPSLKVSIDKYDSYDFDSLVIESIDGDAAAGRYKYYKPGLAGVSFLDLVVQKNKNYTLTLLKGSEVVLQERLK